MTPPPESDQPGDQPESSDPEQSLPGDTGADHPGWGSAPVDPAPTPPPAPEPPAPGPADPSGTRTYPSYPSAGGDVPPQQPPPGYGPPPPGYGPPPPGYGYPPVGAPGPVTNQKAIWALVLGILSFCCCLTGIVGIILGVTARQEIKASGGWQTGDGMALAGIITGAIGLVASVGLGILNFSLGTYS